MKINLPLKTQRLIIDDFSLNDFDRLKQIAYNMQSHFKCNKDTGYYCWSDFRNVQNDEEMNQAVLNFLNKYIKEKESENRLDYHLAVRLPNNLLIGYVAITLYAINEDGLTTVGDPGFFIDPEFCSQGYILESLTTLLDEFFKEFDMSSITTLVDNIPCINLIKKIGGKYITTIQTSYDKGHKDLRYYEIHKDDYIRAINK